MGLYQSAFQSFLPLISAPQHSLGMSVSLGSKLLPLSGRGDPHLLVPSWPLDRAGFIRMHSRSQSQPPRPMAQGSPTSHFCPLDHKGLPGVGAAPSVERFRKGPDSHLPETGLSQDRSPRPLPSLLLEDSKCCGHALWECRRCLSCSGTDVFPLAMTTASPPLARTDGPLGGRAFKQVTGL